MYKQEELYHTYLSHSTCEPRPLTCHKGSSLWADSFGSDAHKQIVIIVHFELCTNSSHTIEEFTINI